jgi:hypothetical protein
MVSGAGPAGIDNGRSNVGVGLGTGIATVVSLDLGTAQGVSEWANPGADCNFRDGAPATAPVSLVTPNGTRVVAVSQLGQGHACELFTIGSTALWCWGANDFHQSLGSDPCPQPGGVFGAPPGKLWSPVNDQNPTKIAVGGNRSCALTSDNGLFCWGDNSDGLLGRGIPIGLPEAPTLAVSGTWSTVAIGPHHTCVVAMFDSTVSCWGLNQFGEVGNGSRFHGTPQRVVSAVAP